MPGGYQVSRRNGNPGSHDWNPLALTGHAQRAREWSRTSDNDGGRSFVDLSQLLLELLRTDEEFVLYRGEYSNQPGSPPVLLLAPASMQPALETYQRSVVCAVPDDCSSLRTAYG